MKKNILFLSVFNFASLVVSFLILPFNYRAFDYGSSAEATQLIEKAAIGEALFNAEKAGFESGIHGYKVFIIFVFVVLTINCIALFVLHKKLKAK
jgi:hypothetical protein